MQKTKINSKEPKGQSAIPSKGGQATKSLNPRINKTLKIKMNKITAFILFFFMWQFAGAQTGVMETSDGHKVTIKTSAICEMCKENIERDMAFEKGVKSAELDLETKELLVVFNPKKTDAETIRKRITKVGYHADTLQRDPVAYNKLPFCCKDGGHDKQ